MDILNQSIQLSGESLKEINNVVSNGSDISLCLNGISLRLLIFKKVH